MGRLNTKITKEYDVKGEHPFSTVFDMRRENETKWKKIKRWFSVRWYALDIKYHEVKKYFKNLVRFNKAMWNYCPWDYHCQIELFAYGLEILANHMDRYGNEIDTPRKKKIAAIRELITLLRNGYEDEVNDKYLGAGEEKVITHVTEYEDGSIGFETVDEESKKIQEASHKVYREEYQKARNAYYDRVFAILRGQDDPYGLAEQIQTKIGEKREDETYDEYQKRYEDCYYEFFDGTGIEGWWD